MKILSFFKGTRLPLRTTLDLIVASALTTGSLSAHAQFINGVPLNVQQLNRTFVSAEANVSPPGGGTLAGSLAGTTVLQFRSTAQGAVSRSVASKLQDVVNAADFGTLCNGTADDTLSIAAAVATGKEVILPVGTCVISNGITTAAQGQIIRGQGKKLTLISIPSTFNMSAAGVFISPNYSPASSNQEGPQFRDFKITFAQPNTSTRAKLRAYPPAFYMQNSPRFQISNIQVSEATNIIDMRGDSGGAFIDNLEGSSWNPGILIDGSTDTVRISRYHFWPFDTTSNQYSVWNDGMQVAIQSARMDDLRLVDDFAYEAAWKFTQSTNGVTFGVISGGDLDSGGQINISAGSMYASSLIISDTAVANQAIVNTGGTFQCSTCSIYSSTATTHPLIQQSGTNSVTAIVNSTLHFTGNMTVASSVGTGSSAAENQLTLIGDTFVSSANPSNSDPVVSNGSGSRLSFIGNRITDIGTGSGNLVSVAADDANVIEGNSFTGWGISLPSTWSSMTVLNNGNVGVAGAGAINRIQGPLTINDATATNASTLNISAPDDKNGVGIKLTGNGSTTPSKTLNVRSGIFQILNSAGTSALLAISESANTVSTPYKAVAAQGVQIPSDTVTSLPICNTAMAGTIRVVSDAASPAYNATVTSGGSTVILALCNGSAWVAH